MSPPLSLLCAPCKMARAPPALRQRRGAAAQGAPGPTQAELAQMAAEDLNTPIIFAKHEKAVKYGTMAISISLTFWLVLFADFGEKEHCFTKVSMIAPACLDTLPSVCSACVCSRPVAVRGIRRAEVCTRLAWSASPPLTLFSAGPACRLPPPLATTLCPSESFASRCTTDTTRSGRRARRSLSSCGGSRRTSSRRARRGPGPAQRTEHRSSLRAACATHIWPTVSIGRDPPQHTFID